MISLRARLVRFIAKKYFRRVRPDVDPQVLRQSFEKIATRLPPARRVRVIPASIAAIDCEWFVPRGCEDAPVLYYLHGGAYVMGSSRTHRRLVSFIARAARVRALLPNYRLAPEHRFPAGLTDSCTVYRHLLAQGLDPAQIAIGGDSAGGGLAVATILKLRDDGARLPACAVLLSPWLDLTGSGESMQTRAGLDPLFRAADMPATADHYCNTNELRNPLVSPLYADVHNLPPVFIQVGDHEILLSDSTRFSDRLSAAGSGITLQTWPDMWHVFQFFIGQMPESGRAVREIAQFLQRKLHAS